MKTVDFSRTFSQPSSSMSRRAFIGRAIIVALTATATSACDFTSSPKSSNTQRDNGGAGASPVSIVSVFDISDSTHNPVVNERYRDGFKQIVAAVHGGDTISGYPISSSTMTTSMARLSVTFPTSRGLMENTDTYTEKFAQAQDDAVRQADSILNLATAEATDLLSAFSDAASIFAGCPGMNRRLIIFSDMVHQTAQYDFAHIDLTPGSTKAIIEAQRQAGLLPPLSGVTVWVAGANAAPTDPAHLPKKGAYRGVTDPKQIAQIRDFWIAFFSACGASLTTDRYSAMLQNYTT